MAETSFTTRSPWPVLSLQSQGARAGAQHRHPPARTVEESIAAEPAATGLRRRALRPVPGRSPA